MAVLKITLEGSLHIYGGQQRKQQGLDEALWHFVKPVCTFLFQLPFDQIDQMNVSLVPDCQSRVAL